MPLSRHSALSLRPRFLPPLTGVAAAKVHRPGSVVTWTTARVESTAIEAITHAGIRRRHVADDSGAVRWNGRSGQRRPGLPSSFPRPAHSLQVSRCLAKNDNARMRRKDLVFELEGGYPAKVDETGWSEHQILVRNLEDVGARLLKIKARNRNGSVLYGDDAYESPRDHMNDKLKNPLPRQREAQVMRRISPRGISRSQSGATPGDTVYIHVTTREVSVIADLHFTWEWSDGQKR